MIKLATKKYEAIKKTDEEIQKMLGDVYASLSERGYNPISQLVGYLITDEPTYITSHNNARTIISQFERNELLEYILKKYFDKEEN